MKTETLIGGSSAVHFRTWNVDSGPMEWDDCDVWAEIEKYLGSDDVRGAAALLRHYLEYASRELCHKLRAPVQFRGDAQYQLGDLLPAAISELKKLYTRAKTAADSWGQISDSQLIGDRITQFNSLAVNSQAEQWQINATVHYNVWDNLSSQEFALVVKAFKELLEGFNCIGVCSESLRVTPERGSAESLRCACGTTNLNLQSK